MTNRDIARLLEETAALIELTDGNPFRARAMRNAARTIQDLDASVAQQADADALTDISGIGDGLAADIREILDYGSFSGRDELLDEVPNGLLDVLRVKGLGTKKVRQLWRELDITSLDELEAAAASDRITQLDGFGSKTQENILEQVRLLRSYDARHRYDEAIRSTEPLVTALRASDAIDQVAQTGALRRALETVRSADFIATGDEDAAHELLKKHATAVSTTDDGAGTRLEGTLENDLFVRLWIVPADRFGTEQWRRTGSDEHRETFVDAHGSPENHAEEKAIYQEAGLPFIAPELREGTGELEAAEEGALPDLITTDDLRGCLHNHSTYSDGKHSVREMAEATRDLGLSYFAICDHSQSLSIANGLTPAEVREQQAEVEALNEELATRGDAPFRVFSGIESDILPDGSLDYDDEILASFDLVVASVHSRFSMDEDEATERIIRAVRNPYTTILGHPTGRLLLAREGYSIDHERVIAACAKHDVAIELNANPQRLDVDWRWIRTATEHGALIAINPDAHSIGELRHMRWGVKVARKGWLTAEHCLNAKPLDEFVSWLDRRRADQTA